MRIYHLLDDLKIYIYLTYKTKLKSEYKIDEENYSQTLKVHERAAASHILKLII